MKVFWSCVLALGSASFTVASAATALTVPPKCGLLCIADLVARSSCELTNTTCICTNQQLVDAIGLCVNANCTIRESLTTKRYSKQTCGAPVADRTKVVSIAGVVGGSLALLAFILRTLARTRGAQGQVGLDDLCIFGTILLNFPFTVFSVILANRGLGKDIWEVPFDNITYILYLYFWDELIYILALPLTKISILFFYLRIFPERKFRRVVWLLMACNVAYCIAFEFISIFQCRPLEGAWTRWDGTFHGTCNNINLQGWMSAGINLVLDIATLCLPLPSLYRLKMSPRKKFQIFFMFGVGSFVTVVSVLRLQFLIQFANTANLTQDYVTIGYWSTIEIHVGIICACMPAIRQLLQQSFPSVLGSTVAHTMQTPVNSSSKPHLPSSMSLPRSYVAQSKHDDNSSVHELIGLAN